MKLNTLKESYLLEIQYLDNKDWACVFVYINFNLKINFKNSLKFDFRYFIRNYVSYQIQYALIKPARSYT